MPPTGRRFNPDTRIILIGDDTNAHFGTEGIEHFAVDAPELAPDVQLFRDIYQHISSQGFEFDRFCIERWFLLRNLMRFEAWESCLHIDSDVLLFCNVKEEAQRFAPYAMTFAHWGECRNLVHTNFINTLEALESFCAYVLKLYQTPEMLEEVKVLNLKYRRGKKTNKSWISDMSLMYSWSQTVNFPFCFLEDFDKDGSCFDPRINLIGGFRACRLLPGVVRPFKDITFSGLIPYGKLTNGEPIVFKSLHYHGYLKFMMKYHSKGENPKCWFLLNLLAIKVKRNIECLARLFPRRKSST